jgi:hypothetical protein
MPEQSSVSESLVIRTRIDELSDVAEGARVFVFSLVMWKECINPIKDGGQRLLLKFRVPVHDEVNGFGGLRLVH